MYIHVHKNGILLNKPLNEIALHLNCFAEKTDQDAST